MPQNPLLLLQAIFAQAPTDGSSGITALPLNTASLDIASQTAGFGENEGVPLGSGGTPVTRPEMNGILNLYSAVAQAIQQLAPYVYNSAYETAIGGYKQGALLFNNAGRIVCAKTDLSVPNNPDSSPNNNNLLLGVGNWYYADAPQLVSYGANTALVDTNTLTITNGDNGGGSGVKNHITMEGRNIGVGSEYSIIMGDISNTPASNSGYELTFSNTVTNPTGLTGGGSAGLYYNINGAVQGQSTRLAYANDVTLVQSDLQTKINTINSGKVSSIEVNYALSAIIAPTNLSIYNAPSGATITGVTLLSTNDGQSTNYEIIMLSTTSVQLLNTSPVGHDSIQFIIFFINVFY